MLFHVDNHVPFVDTRYPYRKTNSTIFDKKIQEEIYIHNKWIKKNNLLTNAKSKQVFSNGIITFWAERANTYKHISFSCFARIMYSYRINFKEVIFVVYFVHILCFVFTKCIFVKCFSVINGKTIDFNRKKTQYTIYIWLIFKKRLCAA